MEGAIFGDEDLEDALQVGQKITYKLAHLRIDDWLKDLKLDKEQLSLLQNNAEAVTTERDAKLDALKKLIAAKANNPTQDKQGQPNRKVLIFTAFADTATYLYQSLKPWIAQELKLNVALVTGGGSQSDYFWQTRL